MSGSTCTICTQNIKRHQEKSVSKTIIACHWYELLFQQTDTEISAKYKNFVWLCDACLAHKT